MDDQHNEWLKSRPLSFPKGWPTWLVQYVAMLRGRLNPPEFNGYWFDDGLGDT
jgi:hypothetical protein